MNPKGTIIVLAWPETPVIKEGKWYDGTMKFFGFLKNGYYKAGHAAILLISHETKAIEYFDFGRYQTPKKKGRVRDKTTDPDIEISTKAIIENGRVKNLEKILKELSRNKATHGKGRLIASEKHIKLYNKAYYSAKEMQKKGAITYGPFNINGTNCTRFVAQLSVKSGIGFWRKLMLWFPYTLTPTTITNVKIINDFGYYYETKNENIRKIKNRLLFFKSKNR